MHSAADTRQIAGPAVSQRRAKRGKRVYISSAATDLGPERWAAIEAVRAGGCEPVAMEFYGADTQRAISRCLQDVRSCDVYVGIVAFRYGSRPPGHDKSFTHLEYEEAVRQRKQILLFHLKEDVKRQVSDIDQAQHKVNRLRSLQVRDHTVVRFSTLDELATGVRRSLHHLYGAVGPKVPELLPYTLDRDAQKDALAAAVERGSLQRSPSVVVMHGGAKQAQGKFVDFLQERLLTQYLGVESPRKFGISLRGAEFESPEVITRRIASSCYLNPTSDIGTVCRQLHNFGSITMLWFPVEAVMRHGRPQVRQVTQIIDYFARWPRYRQLRVLPVISVQYAETPGWRGLLSRGPASQNRFGRAFEGAVGEAAGREVVMLPELTNVEQMEAIVWADQVEVRSRLGGRDPVPVIRQLFQKYERSAKKRGIPMEQLATELTDLLRKSTSVRDSV
ncbi:DUF4062 domain-containing protein [Saccharopolyspora dendranthemae]|nr:DUF4062 domain-containing protein [Saccharopolyspora dendranthemae]